MKQIEQTSGTECIIIKTFEGNIKNEKYLHKQLKNYRLKGEWYKYDEYIKRMFMAFELGVMTGMDTSDYYNVRYI